MLDFIQKVHKKHLSHFFQQIKSSQGISVNELYKKQGICVNEQYKKNHSAIVSKRQKGLTSYISDSISEFKQKNQADNS